MARGVQVGDTAPDFTLPSQSGEQVRLHDRLGEHVVVLYFYPRDDTRGCTAEACAFRDSHEVFAEAGAEVIGCAADEYERGTTVCWDSISALPRKRMLGVPGARQLLVDLAGRKHWQLVRHEHVPWRLVPCQP